jgi:lysophospholipase L1-like esterase
LSAIGLGALAALALVEAALRLARVSPGRVNAGYLQFGFEEGIPTIDEDGIVHEGRPLQLRLFEPDPEVLWRPIAGTPFTNAEGFRGKRDVRRERSPRTLRILYLGDSCTFLGEPVYPELVERALSERFPERTLETLNASAPGYSSLQGLRLLARLAAWRPDVVTVYFGWNDHWPAQGGLTDREQLALGRGPRILAVLRAAWAAGRSEPRPRVPIEEFEENLAAILAAVRALGALPVLLTAPSGFERGAVPERAYAFFAQCYGMDRAAVAAIPEVHEAYAEVVRRVARRDGAVLLDAAADFQSAPGAALFRDDLIHLRAPGHERLAALASAAIATALAR